MKGSAGAWDLLRVPQQSSGMSSSLFCPVFFVCPQECRCHAWGEWTALGCKRKADSGSDAAMPGGRESVHGQEALLVDSAQIVGCVTIGYLHTVKSVPSLDT